MTDPIPLAEYAEPVPVPIRRSYFHAAFYIDLLTCTRCACRAEASRVVPGVGPLDATVMVLGQNPGDEEDADGRPFLGRSGIELESWLDLLGLDRHELLLTNICKCHTERNRVPRMREISVCTQSWLRAELDAFPRLRVVIPLGKPAATVVLGKMKVPTIEALWVQVQFGLRTFHCLPLPHPAYLLRMPGKKPDLYQRVLPQLREYLAREVPEVYAPAPPA